MRFGRIASLGAIGASALPLCTFTTPGLTDREAWEAEALKVCQVAFEVYDDVVGQLEAEPEFSPSMEDDITPTLIWE